MSTPAAETAAPAPATAAAPAGLGDSLAAAFAALRGQPSPALAQAQARVTELEAQLAAATQKATAAEQSAKDARAAHEQALAPFAAWFGLEAGALASLDAAALKEHFDQKVAAAAVQQLAAAHVPAAQLPKPVRADANTGKVLTHDEFNKLTPAARMEFVRAGGRLSTVNLIDPLSGLRN